MARYAAAWLLLCALPLLGGAQARWAVDGTTTAEETVAAAAVDDYGWDESSVTVKPSPVRELDRQGCRFFLVTHSPADGEADAVVRHYALLPGGTAVGPKQAGAVQRILDACGDGAPAGWWAGVVSLFDHRMAGGLFMINRSDRLAIKRIEAAGVKFEEARLEHPGDGTRLRFFAVELESATPYGVKAVWDGSGGYDLEMKRLR